MTRSERVHTRAKPFRLPAKLERRRAGNVIARPRLFEQLDRASGCVLTWVEGPAGAGKSTLVSSYVERQRGRKSIWYRVDGNDTEPATILAHLAQGADAVAGHPLNLPPLTPEYLQDLSGFVRRYFRQMFAGLPANVVVVFDAAETTKGGALPALIRAAVAEVRARQRLVVTSRDGPPPSLMPLQGQGSLEIVGWPALRLTRGEAVALGAAHAASHDLCARLHTLADGWPAGFVLLLATCQRGRDLTTAVDTALAESLFPYFLQELFESADDDSRQLLLRTALLPDFTRAQASALAPGTDVQGKIDELVRSHLFIETVGSAPMRYRYHALFREFLLRHGRERLSPDERRDLVQCASRLMIDAGEDETALRLLLDEKSWLAAAGLVCRFAPRLLAQGRQATLSELLAALPAGSMGEHGVWVDYWRGMAWLRTEPRRARGALEAAFAGFDRTDERRGRMLACASLIETYTSEFGDLHGMDRWGDALKRLWPDLDILHSREVEVAVLSRCGALMLRGERFAALVATAGQRADSLLDTLESAPDRQTLGNFLALWHHLRGEWHVTEGLIERVEQRTEQAGVAPQQRIAWLTLKARMLIWNGEPRRGMEAAVAAECMADENNIGGLHALTSSAVVFAALNLDDPATARGALSRMNDRGPLPRPLDRAVSESHRGMAALAEGDAAAALVDLQAAVERAAAGGAVTMAAMYRVGLALALAQTGAVEQAAWEAEQVADLGRAMGAPSLEFAGLVISAWLALKAGLPMAAAQLLQAALPLGRARRMPIPFPWLPRSVLQALADLALQRDIEPDYVRVLLRARRVPPPRPDADRWSWPVRVTTLGTFGLAIDEQPWAPSGKVPRRPVELLQLLTTEPHRGLSTVEIIDCLWPDLDGDAATNAYNVALYRLRHLLGDPAALPAQDGRVRLNPERVWTDIACFERLAQRLEGEDCSQRQVDDLFVLYRGEYLAGIAAAWAEAPRRRERLRFRQAVAALAARWEAGGRFDSAIGLLRQALTVDPLAENLLRILMRSLEAIGQPEAARAACDACEAALARTESTRLSARTEGLRNGLGVGSRPH